MDSSKRAVPIERNHITMHNPKHAMAKVKKALSTRGRITAAGASLVLLGGGAAVLATGASAATPNCATQCITFSSQAFGQGNVLNANNATNERLRNLSNTYTNEDFVIDGGISHSVEWYVHAGIISSASFAAINYPHYQAVQIEGAPNDVINNKCVGLASPAFNGEGVTKEPCGGVGAQTLWIFDSQHGSGGDCLDAFAGGSSTTPDYCPLINGSDTNFSNPQALTATSSSFQLHVTTENNGGPGTEAGDTQQFTHDQLIP